MRAGTRRLIIFTTLAVFLCAVLVWFEFPVKIIWPALHGPVIEANAQRYGIDPLLITALVKAESGFFKRARSRRGAIGLMQIMPSTGREMAVELGLGAITDADLENPEINVRIGTYYLSKLLKQFNGNIVLALASYNAGPANVDAWYRENPLMIWEISDIPFRETRAYVKNIKWTYTWLKRTQNLKRLTTTAIP